MGPYVLRKASNAENTPLRPARLAPSSSEPSKQARLSVASTIIRSSSHRRRARANGVPGQSTRYAAEQAKRRALAKTPPCRFEITTTLPPSARSQQAKDVEMADVEVKQRPSIKMSAVLPRYLPRPDYRPISKEKVVAIDPGLADVPMGYIQDKLAELGPSMEKVLAGVEATVGAGNGLPQALPVHITDASSDLPTHMLGVYARPQRGARTKLTLFPTHDLVWAANAAKLPALPPRADPAAPALPPTPSSPLTLTLPVLPLCVPDPAAFSELQSYVYTKRPLALLAALLPAAPAAAAPLPAHFTRENVLLLAAALAETYTPHALWAHVGRVQGVWRNASSLGVFDDGLWFAVDLAWEVLLNALACATGKVLSPPTAETALVPPEGRAL